MLQPATISAPPSSGSPSHRQHRSNKKGGSTIALQAQAYPSPTNTNNVKPRNTAQAHTRHQSMPAQRPAPGSPNLTHNTVINSPGNNNSYHNNNKKGNGKRSTVPVVAPAPQIHILQNLSHGRSMPPKTSTNCQIIQRNHFPPQKQKNNQGNNGNIQGSNSKGNNNSNPSSKAKRVQRRKEIAATTETLTKVDLEVAMNQSPLLNSSSPPSSSTDSDDSESTAQLSKVQPQYSRGYSNNLQLRASKQYGLSPGLSSSPPQRPNSAPVIPQSRKG